MRRDLKTPSGPTGGYWRILSLLAAIGLLQAGCRDLDLVPETGTAVAPPPLVLGGGAHMDVGIFGQVANLGGNGAATNTPFINDRGEVAGNWSVLPIGSGASRPMFYAPGGDIIDIGAPAGCQGFTINGLGGDGAVVGRATGCVVAGSPNGTNLYGYRWRRGVGFQLLPPLPGPLAPKSEAYATNSNGVVVGTSVYAGQTVLTRWNAAGVPEVATGPYTGGGFFPSETFVNANGVVAGLVANGGETPAPTSAAFVWLPGESSAREIYSAPNSNGGLFLTVRGINASGTVVGIFRPSNGLRFFRWTLGGALQDLGPALDVTSVVGPADDESIAGYASGPSSTLRSFRWTPSTGMQLLPVPASVSLLTLNGISPNGIFTGSYFTTTSTTERAFRYTAAGFQGLELVAEIGMGSARGMNVNSDGDVVGFWFFPHNWAVWRAAPPNHAPIAVIAPTSDADEGTAVVFDGTASADTDGDPLTYQWTFGDGANGSGPTPTHTYADNGTYTVGLTVGDGKATQSASTTLTVRNVAPTTGVSAPLTAAAGSSITLSAVGVGDPSTVDVSAGLKFSFDCGSGFGGPFGSAISTSCAVAPFGSRVLRVIVLDKDGGLGSASTTVRAIDDMNVQPAAISLSATGTVTAYVYSAPGFDATKTTAASVRMIIVGGNPSGAPVATRNGAAMTSVGDYNGDGIPDRLFVFLRTDLQAAGLTTTRTAMRLEDQTGVLKFTAADGTPPTITP